MTQWILVAVGVLTLISSFFSWLTRQQMQIVKLELESRLATMELRLLEKIGGTYVTMQVHNDLAARMDRMECQIRSARNYPTT